jgi:glycosyltransferase involved in cell wall biosynthesis
MCVFNGERFLREALNSVLSQEYRTLELIVVDDGSSDSSLVQLVDIRDPRVRVIRQSNQGASVALAAGIEAARGAYVALLDQDDRWEREFLSAHVEFLEQHPDVDLSFSWFRVVNEEGRDIGLASNRYLGRIDFSGLLADFVIGASSNVVVRREALAQAGGPDPSLSRYYDLDLCLRVALLRPNNVAAIRRDLMHYRRHSQQITHDIEGMQGEWGRVLLKLEALAPEQVSIAAPAARANMSRYFARLAYESGQYGRGLSLLGECFRSRPGGFFGDPRNWLTAAACLSGLLLPAAAHRRLEHLAGLRR